MHVFSDLFLITGIANSDLLHKHIEKNFNLVAHIDNQDHYRYSKFDFQTIEKEYGSLLLSGELSILITEKDASKWRSESLKPLWENWSVHFLPIELHIIDEEPAFIDLVRNSLKSYPKLA